MPAKANVSKSGCGVDVDTQTAYPAFAVQDGDISERLGVFQCGCKVQVARQHHKALRLYLEVPDVTGLLRVNNVTIGFVDAQVRGQVYIYGVGTNCARYHRLYYDVALVEGVE